MFANNKDVNKFKKAMNSIYSCLAPIDTKGELSNHFYDLLAYLVYYKNNGYPSFMCATDEEIKKIVDDGTRDIRNFINDAAEIFQTPKIDGIAKTHDLEKVKIEDEAYGGWIDAYYVSYAITKLPSYAYAAYKVSRQRSCIEKNGSHLSDTGAFNLFKRELNYAMNLYGITPDVSLSDILRDTINASRGVIPTSEIDF
ncbi:hypothetical protein [Gardnerella sp. DNF01199S]|uniref:hypothetical protein n=1 Tax=Gardnerella sp. DNF01199S TaxID=2749067 RepID=UPI003BACDE44